MILFYNQCATICDEHELCNTFDYCFDRSKNGDLDTKNIKCRLHTDTYNTKNVKLNSSCSIYATIRPKIPVKKTVYRQKTYSKGLTVALSFVALIAGSSIGVLASFFVIRKCLKEDDDY